MREKSTELVTASWSLSYKLASQNLKYWTRRLQLYGIFEILLRWRHAWFSKINWCGLVAEAYIGWEVPMISLLEWEILLIDLIRLRVYWPSKHVVYCFQYWINIAVLDTGDRITFFWLILDTWLDACLFHRIRFQAVQFWALAMTILSISDVT